MKKIRKPDRPGRAEDMPARSRLLVFGNDGRETTLSNFLFFGALLRR